jgi:hypothetical protein
MNQDNWLSTKKTTLHTYWKCKLEYGVWISTQTANYLRGKRFILYTEHKPLKNLGHLHKKTLNRLQIAMNKFDFEIRYKKGINMPADYLS